MIDMKMSAEERKEQDEISPSEQEYPWGLQISLNDDSLAKLGITALPPVGSKITFTAVSSVCSTSAYQREGTDAETSLSLQITAMEITDGAQESKDAATTLYG